MNATLDSISPRLIVDENPLESMLNSNLKTLSPLSRSRIASKKMRTKLEDFWLDLSLRTLSERVDELTKNIGELANLLRHLFKQSEQRWGRYIS